MLGDKKSEEPYSSDDVKLLQAIARQIAAARETVRLRERIDEDRHARHDVLSHLATAHVGLLRECPACGACYDAPATTCHADGAELKLTLPIERNIEGKAPARPADWQGRMGAVYEAADLRLARAVAIKVMLGRDRHALKRFEREAQASARLTHPHIVTVFDVGAVGADGAFFVMELLRGRTLRAELDRRGRLPPPIAASWFEQICAAVAAAHQQGIVHRDLKPENVFVTQSASPGGLDVVKVLDFGLAKMAASGDVDGAGAAASPIPALSWGRPVHGARTADRRRDRRALRRLRASASWAAEAITGGRPSAGRTHAELLQVIMNEPLTLGGDGAERRQLESVLQRAAAKDAARRYASVVDLARDLPPALRALPPDAPASGTSYQMPHMTSESIHDERVAGCSGAPQIDELRVCAYHTHVAAAVIRTTYALMRRPFAA